MQLVYTATQKPVTKGDTVEINGQQLVIEYFAKPHKCSSQGKVSLRPADQPEETPNGGSEYYVSVIGAEWIEREDRLAHA